MKLETMGGLRVRIVGGELAVGGPVTILFHGFGAPGDDLVPLASALAASRSTRFVFPEAPIDLGPRFLGGRAWWRIDLEERMRRMERGEARDIQEVPEGLEAARALVDALVDEVEQKLRPERLFLGGFSQGAMIALDAALRSDKALAGLVLLSGTHIAAAEWAPRMSARRGLPVFMSHGTDDELLPFAISERLRDDLSSHGLAVEWHAFRGGHGIPESVLHGVDRFLERYLAP